MMLMLWSWLFCPNCGLGRPKEGKQRTPKQQERRDRYEKYGS